ncbi:helix-turn-helix transcriptional regulator [Actinocorallia sp. API 0066]|uniref:winged helix-turn-helix transcriptional regulator n=1 Tax=Actinocorallia sp. API 0066 TaxID=2896846 RepID=UPI001E391C31|nr:helix-turn-helix domain-containing protein [Actinocorallia sp. API 0066]MCD0451110.1 helix-turn-helix transcriptional regulator [Actinocorallia sp. API 0066]
MTYEPCADDCGIREVLDRLGDRWSVLVVVALGKGAHRFRELQRAVPGISQRMLTVTTRRLVRDGLVRRTVHDTVPPQVEYQLTDLGLGFATMVDGLAAWSREHRPAINEARATFDAADQSPHPAATPTPRT